MWEITLPIPLFLIDTKVEFDTELGVRRLNVTYMAHEFHLTFCTTNIFTLCPGQQLRRFQALGIKK